RTTTPSFAIATARAAKRNELGGAQDTTVSAQCDYLSYVISRPDSSAGHQDHFIADTFLDKEAMHLRNGQLYRHCNVLLGNLWCRSRAAISTINLNNMRSSIVASHGHHINVRGCRDFDRDKRIGIDGFNPVNVFLVIFNRIDTVKRKWRKQADPWHTFTHFSDRSRCFITQQVAAKPRFCSLGILELYDRRP